MINSQYQNNQMNLVVLFIIYTRLEQSLIIGTFDNIFILYVLFMAEIFIAESLAACAFAQKCVH